MRIGLFPGQGIPARIVDKALPDRDPLLSTANEVLGYDVRRKTAIAARRPSATLPTSLAQPAIFTAGLIAWSDERDRNGSCDCFAGHSLGEYAALVAADAMTFEDGLRAVAVRGEAMQEAARRHPGGMAAVLGLEWDDAVRIATEAQVAIANNNAPGQVVLSGSEAGLATAAQLVRAAGGRAVLLDVAGPFHTISMAPAAPALKEVLDTIDIKEPRVPVMSNVTARPHGSPHEIRALLVQQMTDPVHFRESIEWLWEQGARDYIDLGPGRVAAGLAQKTFDHLIKSKEAARA
ncbi:MAG: ACP S-malonyltransferase [Actinomycetota bacterium]